MLSSVLCDTISTERISEAKSEGFRFEMEPDYKTGDEVEVLARSFSELSRRMDGYIEEIKAVTAEKEHISAEPGVAANAGHEHTVLKRKDGVAELVKYKHSPIVGMIEDAQYEEHSFKPEKGDLLFVYTDGVPEATDKDEKQFGTDRMLQILNAIPQNIEINDVLEKVYEGIERFTLGSEQFDDITMLAFRYLGDGK